MSNPEQRHEHSFRHEAFLYAGQDGFLDGAVKFLRDGVEEHAATLVVVSAAKIELLRDALDGDAEAVHFADMAEIGTNPARIIPAWREFVDEHAAAGRLLRGIGEPIWAERSASELVECQRHESLLNLAFADTPDFRLLCPYDVDALDDAVIEEAQRSHPHLVDSGGERPSVTCRTLEEVALPFAEPLPDAPAETPELAFEADSMDALRMLVARRAADAGIHPARARDLILAVNEVATNSVRHGGGDGVLRIWEEPEVLVCEVRDRGRIERPLAGRERPARDQIGGYGLWLANQLCELVQLRTFPKGSVARLHMRRDQPA